MKKDQGESEGSGGIRRILVKGSQGNYTFEILAF